MLAAYLAGVAYVSASVLATRLAMVVASMLVLAAGSAAPAAPVAPSVLAPVFVSVSALEAGLGLVALRRQLYRTWRD